MSTATDSTGPLVTATLVCWNHRRFVRQAVLSALEQTYPHVELIVIDNGSTDGSQDDLRALRDQHGFTLILQDNVGLVRALNQALEIARGKYIACLATDDVWLPEKTARQVALLEANPDVHVASGQIACIDAAMISALACFVDYRLTPRRLTPPASFRSEAILRSAPPG